ncbi:MAG: hypothetical protein LBU58_01410, partial [Clostridiales bacterium]|nr:hypothetical protein [Clostridiales bacterium]
MASYLGGTGTQVRYGLRTKDDRKRLLKALKKYKLIYLMAIPVFALIILFRYVPIYGIQLAFKTYTLAGIAKSPWVGFQHFRTMMSEPEFFSAFRNTIIISLYRVIFAFPVPILLSLMLNEIRQKKVKRTLQTVFTFPHFLSWVVVAGLMLNLLGDSGVIKKVVSLYTPEAAASWNILYNRVT